MATVSVDVDEAVAKEMEKKDRKIKMLEGRVAALTNRNTTLEDTMKRMKRAKDALLEAADWLDPFRYDDE